MQCALDFMNTNTAAESPAAVNGKERDSPEREASAQEGGWADKIFGLWSRGCVASGRPSEAQRITELQKRSFENESQL